MMANKAHYGLQYFTENNRKVDQSARMYLEQGLQLCKRLVEGEKTRKRGRITEVRQLGSLADVEPKEISVTVGRVKPQKVLKTFVTILQAKRTSAVSSQQLREAQDFLLRISDAYTKVAFKELGDLESAED
jgi:hypothetical protein